MVIILLVAIASFYTITSSNITTQINAQQKVSLHKSGALYFLLPGNPNTYVAYLSNTSQSSAVLYVTKSPILTNPIEVISLPQGASSNVSTSLSSSADMEITLLSSNLSGALFYFTPIPKYLNIKASNIARLIDVNGSVQQYSSYATTTIIPSQSNSSAKVQSTTLSTTVLSSTTVSQYPVSSIFSVLNLTPIGKLMNDYSSIYAQTKSCTPALYNATYNQYVHTMPTGLSSYANISQDTPTGFTTSIAQVAVNVYNISYVPVVSSSAPSMFKDAYVTAEVNISSFSVSAYAFKGIWTGLNYTSAYNAYSFEASIGNDCNAYIPYTP